MDALSLDRLLDEARPRVVGRAIEKVRARGRVVLLELAHERARLILSAWPRCAGAWLVPREAVRGASEAPPAGRDGHGLLLLRKHLEGARISAVARVEGERTLWIETSGGTLALRASGTAPAISLVRENEPVATLFGEAAWPLPAPRPGGDWWRAAAPAGKTAAERLRECPGLGPWLAKAWDGSAATWQAWQQAAPAPHIVSRAPSAGRDAAAAAGDLPELWPIPPGDGRHVETGASWGEAARRVLDERRRGEAFGVARQGAQKAARERARRLAQLLAHLEGDRDRLEPEAHLRRAGEAILADPASVPAGAAEATVADPYGGPPMKLKLDPRLRAVDNADRLFARAKRNTAARARIEARIRETREALSAARAEEATLADAREGSELPAVPAREAEPPREGAKPRRFLTSGGLLLHVGRGAKENHALTFGLARPEDHWFHARDVPGAHVILRDPENRASADDLREAAEVAAFHSAAREATAVDVHVARRKHLRSVRGAAGRVLMSHSDTLRVAPRDPEGRLRRR